MESDFLKSQKCQNAIIGQVLSAIKYDIKAGGEQAFLGALIDKLNSIKLGFKMESDLYGSRENI